ncbi:type II secretion system major pseudopilin GspG [Gilvimarinus agarilyticus]|uniref:type II secretion system major pseudopilin GspG n=1 Tax=unclassified Gilvimarinus TaxID=2642066 RepID=UPI001C0A3EF3|nr:MULTISPECIES: type II secretion system major pseudopilin GspG [unclassified Gilvimarinus]MBU2886247.1 type II secretion system major pseudopilin GspG [Gilvimarinus agarilyticus]MDO6570935.1 type II secretion system major pseudopilin GspG [Gilvimarinus sp. 2_MG-2023]MDO6747778.1 type II secretion system major pseudopilin GspG [Gilvimarinus sp. 1_MG-2023]
MQHTTRQSGFSLIEIMVVVVIIGLLASIVAPMVLDRAEEARINKVKADFKSIQTALKLYQLDNYVFPSSEHGLKALMTEPTLSPVPRNYRAGGYLDQVPMDPWGSPYLYISPGEARPYDIYTLGADGVSGGTGPAADISVWDQDLPEQ